MTDCGQDCVVEWRELGKKKKVASHKACCDSNKIRRYVQQFAVDRVP